MFVFFLCYLTSSKIFYGCLCRYRMTGSNVGKLNISFVAGEYPGTLYNGWSYESTGQESGEWQFDQVGAKTPSDLSR